MDYTERAVPVATLDAEFRENRAWLDKFTRRFLKIDTQGFEKSVLLGAEQSLGEIAGVMMECSLTPIYDGQWPLEEAFAHMRARGFTPWAIRRGFAEDHREYEMDVVFFREDVVRSVS